MNAHLHNAGADLLLSQLESARRSGRGWIARCPAHTDKTASLSVTETNSGMTLIHCFAGCSALEVVQSVGLTLAHLFPVQLQAQTPAECRAVRRGLMEAGWRAALGVLGMEATVTLIASAQMLQGRQLSPEDHDRLHLAHDRIENARAALR